MEVTMDSGCGKSCIGKKLIPGYEVKPSKGSMNGQRFIGPGGEVYPNEGEANLAMVHAMDGRPCRGTFQVADGLQKTLMAVSDCNDRGNLVAFDNDGSGLIPRDSPEGRQIRRLIRQALDKKQGVEVRRKNGVFVMPVWIAPPTAQGKAGFPRPAKAAP